MSVEGYTASGMCEISYTFDDVKTGTQNFSATSLGATYNEAINNLYESLNKLVENFFKEYPSYKLIKKDYFNINCWPAGPSKLTLYYTLLVENGKVIDDADLYPNSNSFQNATYHMSNSNYKKNDDIINFSGYKTDANILLNLPPTFGEIATILIPSDGSQVSAQSLYIDYGNTFVSTVQFTLYNISSASGIFENFTVMKINFLVSDTNIKKRTIEFY
jgi:hypothetical protein